MFRRKATMLRLGMLLARVVMAHAVGDPTAFSRLKLLDAEAVIAKGNWRRRSKGGAPVDMLRCCAAPSLCGASILLSAT